MATQLQLGKSKVSRLVRQMNPSGKSLPGIDLPRQPPHRARRRTRIGDKGESNSPSQLPAGRQNKRNIVAMANSGGGLMIVGLDDQRVPSDAKRLAPIWSISAFFANLRKANVLRKHSKPISKLVAIELQSTHCSTAPMTCIISVTRSLRLAKQSLLIHRRREHRFWRSKAQLLSRLR